MNGHVHLKSIVRSNVINAGSLLVSSQGELRVGDYPTYYTVDTKTGDLIGYPNKYSMIYLTCNTESVDKLSESEYDHNHLVLRVEYTGGLPEIEIDSLHTSYRKLVEDIESTQERELIKTTNFDMKNYLTEYIKKDMEISEDEKENYIKVGVELLS